MSGTQAGLFHCGRCGALFEAQAGGTVVRRCPECGGDPVPPPPCRELAEATQGQVSSHDRGGGSEGGDARRSRSKRSRKVSPAVRNLVIFISVWVLLLGVFAVSVKMVHERGAREDRERAAQRRRAQETTADGARRGFSERDRVFLTKAVPGCRVAFFSFLQSVTPEARAQWILGGAATIGRMQRFYQANTLFLPEKMPEQQYIGVLETNEGPMVESLWLTSEGYRVEAVFRRERGEWRLDWDGFTRFSEMPWVMFLAGAGDPVQEFRLLARERLAGDRKHDPALSLVFHPPRFGVPDDVGAPSPEFVVPRLSEPGRRLEALFELRSKGKTPLGAEVPRQDPDDMIRVRVKVRREVDEQGGKKFLLEEVLAGHWLNLAESGIPEELEAPPPVEATGTGSAE